MIECNKLYDGSIEIKDRDGQKYIYIRKRILGRNTSTYVDSYSDELLTYAINSAILY